MVCGKEMRHCNFYHASLQGKAIISEYNSNTTKIISSGRPLKAQEEEEEEEKWRTAHPPWSGPVAHPMEENNTPPWSGPVAHPMEDAARCAEPTNIFG